MNKISKNDRFLKTNDKNKNERFNIVLTNLKKRSYFTEWTNFRKDLEITMVFFLLKEQCFSNKFFRKRKFFFDRFFEKKST